MKMWEKSSLYFFEIIILLMVVLILLATISGYKKNFEFKITPTKNPSVLLDYPKKEKDLDIKKLGELKAFFVGYFDNNLEKILFEKNATSVLPIASITKLITAVTVLNNNDTSGQTIVLDKDALIWKGSSARFEVGEAVTFFHAFNMMLIESNNDIARAFAIQAGENKFVQEMNSWAQKIGMNDSSFTNSTGLDPDLNIKPNLSTAKDLYILLKYLNKNYKNILDITKKTQYPVYDGDNIKYTINSTNELLSWANIPFQIIGGKTGQTPNADKNLVLITRAPITGGYIVFVVLGAKDHFASMRALMQETKDSYRWN